MKKTSISLAATLALLVGAVVLGMVLAGAFDLTPSIYGSNSAGSNSTGSNSNAASVAASGVQTPERQGSGFSDPVAAHASEQISSFADLAEVVLPAVVTVNSTTIEEGGSERFRDLFRGFPGRDQLQPRDGLSRGVGSGFLISPDGWIVTNHHVIAGASKVEVTLDEERVEAEVRGFDQSTDLAVLKIEGKDLPFLEFGNSESLRVGDWVMAVGSPLGIGASVTVGVVSAKGRILGITGDRAFDDFIQTDAAINRGNSGGPLLNTRGQVVGVATAMNYAAENIGFAVSAKVLNDVIPQLRDGGRVARGYLGVAIDDLDEDLVAMLPGVDSTNGAVILGIAAEPARRGGLKEKDVVVSVDGDSIVDVADLIARVSRRQPGESIELGIVRRGREIKRTVVLGDREEVRTEAPQPPAQTPIVPTIDWLDADVTDLTGSLRNELGIDSQIDGVVLQQIGANSPLAEKGLRPYDVIREVNGEQVGSAAEFRLQLGELESGDRLMLFVHSPSRGGFQDLMVVRVP